jgi:hypothetical protein
MPLDAITAKMLIGRVMTDAGKDVPDGEFPTEWWLDAINKAVDEATSRLVPVHYQHFATEKTFATVTLSMVFTDNSLVPVICPMWEKPPNILWVKNNSNVEVKFIDPRHQNYVSGNSMFDGKTFWFLRGNTIVLVFGTGATATGTWTVNHAARRTAVTALTSVIDLSREFLPIVEVDMRGRLLRRMQGMKYAIRDEDIGLADKDYLEQLAKVGVDVNKELTSG